MPDGRHLPEVSREGRRPQGFTLVETLVVTGVVMVLSSIVFAAIGGALDRAGQATDMSNLRQIGQAREMYRADDERAVVLRFEHLRAAGLVPTSVAASPRDPAPMGAVNQYYEEGRRRGGGFRVLAVPYKLSYFGYSDLKAEDRWEAFSKRASNVGWLACLIDVEPPLSATYETIPEFGRVLRLLNDGSVKSIPITGLQIARGQKFINQNYFGDMSPDDWLDFSEGR